MDCSLPRDEVALDSLLQSVTDGEASIEKARQHLCSLDDFSAEAVFSSLRRSSNQGCLCLAVFYEWFSAQPQIWSRVALSSEEFQDLMIPSADAPIKGMDYDGFLLLVLPRDDEELLGRTLARGAGRPWQYNAPSGRMPPEVAFRFCSLLDAELSFQRSLRRLSEGLQACDDPCGQVRNAIQATSMLRIFLKDARQRAVVRRLQNHEDVMARGLFSLEALDQLMAQEKIAVFDKPYLVGKTSRFHGMADRMQLNSVLVEDSVFPRLKLSVSNTNSVKVSPKVSDGCRRTLRVSGNAVAQTRGAARAPSTQCALVASPTTPNKLQDDGALLRSLLRLAVQQGELDAVVEAVRLDFPAPLLHRLDVIFNALDRFNRGFLSETDLKQFSVDAPGAPHVEFRHICTLLEQTQNLASIVRHNDLPLLRDAAKSGGAVGFGASLDSEMLSGFPVDSNMPGRLSLRDFLFLVLAIGAPITRTLRHASSDADVRSLLVILRESTPCPGCGANIQRDSDARGCPHVECPMCGFIVECMVLSSGELSPSDPHAVTSMSAFRRFLVVAAANAQECCDLRQQFHDRTFHGCDEGEATGARRALERHADKLGKVAAQNLPALLERHELAVPNEDALLFAGRRLQLLAAQYGQAKS